jgi:hypothetical protein
MPEWTLFEKAPGSTVYNARLASSGPATSIFPFLPSWQERQVALLNPDAKTLPDKPEAKQNAAPINQIANLLLDMIDILRTPLR